MKLNPRERIELHPLSERPTLPTSGDEFAQVFNRVYLHTGRNEMKIHCRKQSIIHSRSSYQTVFRAVLTRHVHHHMSQGEMAAKPTLRGPINGAVTF